MIALWLATGVLAKTDGQPPEPIARPRGDDAGTLRRFWQSKRTEEIEERLAVIERVAAVAKRRKVSLAQIEAAQDAIEWLTEAQAAPIAVAGIEQLVDALNAAATRRMAFAKALERHAEAVRVEQKRRKRNEEAALVLLLA